jgi:hypothetical protein
LPLVFFGLFCVKSSWFIIYIFNFPFVKRCQYLSICYNTIPLARLFSFSESFTFCHSKMEKERNDNKTHTLTWRLHILTQFNLVWVLKCNNLIK